MSEEYREHIRVHLNCTVFIETASGMNAAGEAGAPEILLCKTLDVSYGGLKVSLGKELTVGAILQIGVELPGLDETQYLMGEVKWCRPDGDPETGWAAGFLLLQSDETDIDGWRELLAHV